MLTIELVTSDFFEVVALLAPKGGPGSWCKRSAVTGRNRPWLQPWWPISSIWCFMDYSLWHCDGCWFYALQSDMILALRRMLTLCAPIGLRTLACDSCFDVFPWWCLTTSLKIGFHTSSGFRWSTEFECVNEVMVSTILDIFYELFIQWILHNCASLDFDWGLRLCTTYGMRVGALDTFLLCVHFVLLRWVSFDLIP